MPGPKHVPSLAPIPTITISPSFTPIIPSHSPSSLARVARPPRSPTSLTPLAVHRLSARNTTALEDELEVEDNDLFVKNMRKMRLAGRSGQSSGRTTGTSGGREGQAQCHDAYLAKCKELSLTPDPTHLRRTDGDLHRIDIAHRGLGALRGSAVAAALPKLPAVEILRVADNRLSDASCASLVKGVGKVLQHVDLSQNQVGAATLEVLANVFARRNVLTHLHLSNVGLGDRGTTTLTRALGRAGALVQSLDVSRNDIGVDGGVSLGKLVGSSATLVTLNASWNTIRARGAVSIAGAMSSNSSLTELNLAWNSFASVGCARFARSLRSNSTLVALNLTSNHICDADCAILGKLLVHNTGLRTVELSGNPISEEGVKALAKAVKRRGPPCDIALIDCTQMSMLRNDHSLRPGAAIEPSAKDAKDSEATNGNGSGRR